VDEKKRQREKSNLYGGREKETKRKVICAVDERKRQREK
jgi:hypothetical protein